MHGRRAVPAPLGPSPSRGRSPSAGRPVAPVCGPAAGALLRRSGSASPAAGGLHAGLFVGSGASTGKEGQLPRPRSASVRVRQPPSSAQIQTGSTGRPTTAPPSEAWLSLPPPAPSTPLTIGDMTGHSQPASSCSKFKQKRAASVDAGTSVEQLLADKHAEMGLLRARFNLRLDAERVKTQDASSALRKACEEATKSQHDAAMIELASMRQHFEETQALQQSTHTAALREERLRMTEAQSAWRVEMSTLQHANVELEANLDAARLSETRLAEIADSSRKELDIEISVERTRNLDALAEMQATLAGQRESIVESVVSRFEREHFELTAEVAKEHERRREAERNLTETRARLEELRHKIHESSRFRSLHLENQAAANVSYCTRFTQTDVESAAPRSAPMEGLAMRLSDIEGQQYRALDAEAERLDLLAGRFRRAVAVKNETIEELKDELRRREREISDARSIMAGLRTPLVDHK